MNKIQFNSQVIIENGWEQFKEKVSNKNLRVQFEEVKAGQWLKYEIFAIDGNVAYKTFIYTSSVPQFSTDADGVLITQELNDSWKQDFEQIYKNNANKQIDVKQANSAKKVAIDSRLGKETIHASHSFADATTWYTQSVRRVNIELTSEDGITWSSQYNNWIDMTHGKVFDEDALIADQMESDDPHGYNVIIEKSIDNINWTEVTQTQPFSNVLGQCTVNYSLGHVIFSQQFNGYVRATFSSANGSAWVLKPSDNRALVIELAEVQFSNPITMNDTIIMEVYGYVDYFAPELLVANGGMLEAKTLIPIEITKYKTITQLIDEAVGSFVDIPALGGNTRGITNPVHIFQFRYGTAKQLFSSLGMELRLRLENNVPYSGERCTATFYKLSKNDPGVSDALELLAG